MDLKRIAAQPTSFPTARNRSDSEVLNVPYRRQRPFAHPYQPGQRGSDCRGIPLINATGHVACHMADSIHANLIGDRDQGTCVLAQILPTALLKQRFAVCKPQGQLFERAANHVFGACFPQLRI